MRDEGSEEASCLSAATPRKAGVGEFPVPDRVKGYRDLLKLLLGDTRYGGVAGLHGGAERRVRCTPKLGDVKASKLTTAQVKEYIRDRLKKVKPGTVNRELGMLHRAFHSAISKIRRSWGRVPHFPKFPEGEPPERFLKPELYKSCCSPCRRNSGCFLSLLITLAYEALLLRIKWTQVDVEASCIWMEGKKVNRKPEPVAVPIYGDMTKFLALQPRNSEFLFARGSKPIKDFRESWNLACEAAGVPGLLFHDLRRTAVRNLRRAGVAESVIMKSPDTVRVACSSGTTSLIRATHKKPVVWPKSSWPRNTSPTWHKLRHKTKGGRTE